MKYEDKIYFLEDIIDELVKDGYDRDIIEHSYNYFREKLHKEIHTKTDIAYKLGSLGTLFFTFPALSSLRLKGEAKKAHAESIGNEVAAERYQGYLENVKERRQYMRELVERAKKNNTKKLLFFRKRANQQKILND